MRASARELLVPFLTPLVWRDRGANPRPTAPQADALTTRLSGPVNAHLLYWPSKQGQLLKGAEYHIYLYCFTFVYIDLNRAFVIIVSFPKNYSSKKVCANDIGKWNALGICWYNFYSFILIISATFFQLKILH